MPTQGSAPSLFDRPAAAPRSGRGRPSRWPARIGTVLDEMERLGAFDREYLLLVSPTGTGWVDHTVVESAEILARGDIATACIQYGKAPSFLELQGVSLGRAQFRQLLWGVRQRLRTTPPEDRPKVLVFGLNVVMGAEIVCWA